MAPVILSGVGAFTSRGDLLDRAIVLRLPRLGKRTPKEKLRVDFAKAHPKLLGALLDAAVLALRNQDHAGITGGGYPRQQVRQSHELAAPLQHVAAKIGAFATESVGQGVCRWPRDDKPCVPGMLK